MEIRILLVIHRSLRTHNSGVDRLPASPIGGARGDPSVGERALFRAHEGHVFGRSKTPAAPCLPGRMVDPPLKLACPDLKLSCPVSDTID